MEDKRTARPVMVQSTASHAGKSLITAALCRILSDRGLRVAPFKAQNMALNSHVTADGGEIGVAQALQAQAARIEPCVDLNPVLLKPTADSVAQVIIHGKVYGSMSAVEYHAFKKEARRFVLESYSRLAPLFDVIVIEGAGSPAEINLRDNDIANMGVAEITGSPVILVGDIDRGGVFASIVGTLELLRENERERIKGFIINKFRGDRTLLEPGIDFLTEKTGIETIGVIPFFDSLNLPDEDGVALQGRDSRKSGDEAAIKIKVIKLPRISNFTDFDPLKATPGVALEFIEEPAAMDGADMVIIPGTKNTQADLGWLRKQGFCEALLEFHARGGRIAGICGGFQMLGRTVKDPLGVESGIEKTEGLSLLDTETVLQDAKATHRVEAELCGLSGGRVPLKGFEIHMGETAQAQRPLARIKKRGASAVDIADGAVSEDGLVWGTYIHGIFDNDPFRRLILDGLRKRNSADGPEQRPYWEVKEENLNNLSTAVERDIDMGALFDIIGLG